MDFLKRIGGWVCVFHQKFNENIFNYISLWAVVYGFITSIIANNIQVTWVCYVYQIGLVVFGIMYQYTPTCLMKIKDLIKIFNCFLLTLGLAFNFISTTEIIKVIRSTMYDEFIVQSDTFLFPLFKKGQLSLLIDSNQYLNPSTFNGKLLNDYFEIVYITFYVWGYLSFGICCLEIGIEWWNETRSCVEEKYDSKKNQRYLEMEYLVVCWSCTFSLIFLINIFVPGKSPRIFLQNDFTHKIEGFGFSSWWRSHIDRDDSSGTFPSGHCGETLAVALGIYYSHKTLGRIVFVMTAIISLSTIWNRYHYVTDLLIGALCSLFGYFMANVHLRRIQKNK